LPDLSRPLWQPGQQEYAWKAFCLKYSKGKAIIIYKLIWHKIILDGNMSKNLNKFKWKNNGNFIGKIMAIHWENNGKFIGKMMPKRLAKNLIGKIKWELLTLKRERK
jgi:hypothetical protein